MPFYNYQCTKECKVKQLPKELKEKLCIEKHPKGMLVWTEQHAMPEDNKWPKIACPLCSSEAKPTWHGINQQGYTRGDCYLNRGDCNRQMDLDLLSQGRDPYGHMRQPGEVDELKKKLKKAKIKRR